MENELEKVLKELKEHLDALNKAIVDSFPDKFKQEKPVVGEKRGIRKE